jgi:hypothetical protein
LGESRDGALASAGLLFLPSWGAFAWPAISRLRLPAPHDNPIRPLQIWMAGLLLAGLALVVWRCYRLLRRRGDGILRPRWTAIRLFGLGWLAFMLAGAWTAQWTSTGDTPQYLLLTRALAERFSHDLSPDLDQRAFVLFHDKIELEKAEQFEVPDGQGGTKKVRYSQHRMGLPAAVAPGWVLLGPWGARWLHMAYASAAVALLFFVLARGAFAAAALPLWALLAFSAPWLLQSQGMMPDLFMAIIWAAALAAWAGALPLWVAYLAAGWEVWINPRGLPLGGMLALATAWRFKAWRWRGLALTGALAAGAMALQAYEFGSAKPTGIFVQNKAVRAEVLRPDLIPASGLGQFFDQEYGLLFWCPAFALALVGLARLLTRKPRETWPGLLVALAYFAPTLTVVWWHGYMSPSRYLLPILPQALLWMAAAWDPRSALQRVLVLWTLGTGLLFAVLPWLSYSKMLGQNLLLRLASERLQVPLTRWAPSYTQPRLDDWVLGAVLLALLGTWAWRQRRQPLP